MACALMLAGAAVTTRHALWGLDLSAWSASQPVDTIGPVTVQADGSMLVNTTDIGRRIQGFAGPTPVEIMVIDGKIASVKALDNDESPGFFESLYDDGLFDRWNGLTVAQAQALDVDAVTGATYSSTAVIANVHAGLTALPKADASSSSFKFTWKLLIGIIVVLCAAFLPLFVHSQTYRIIQQLANVVVLGFWCGAFVSFGSMLSLVANGINLATGIVVFVMIMVAFVWPLFNHSAHYCTWMCPLGSAQDLAGRLSRCKLHLSPPLVKNLQRARLVLWCLLMLMLWGGVLIEWTDYELFATFIVTEAPIWMLCIAVAFLVLSVFIPRPYCRFVCPTGTLLRLQQSLREFK